MQARFSAGLTHSTLKVYVAAIAAYHAPLGGQKPPSYVFPLQCAEPEASGMISCPECAFKLPGPYVTPPVTSRPSIGLITHVIQSVVTLKVLP